MRAALALIVFSLALAACATPSAGPSYALTVLDVRGSDLYARTADFGLSRADCEAAAKTYPRAICEAEK